MDSYTKDTRDFLEERFETSIDGIYYAHQPIYGFRTPYADHSAIAKYIVTKSILNALNHYSFASFADIGGAEGYAANIARQLFNLKKVGLTDLSANACKMAKEIFNIDAIPSDIHSLPFADNEFDAVLCSETLEHVTDYRKAIDELLRITKKVLVITVPHETPEQVAETIRKKIPHGHINYFEPTTLDYLKERGLVVKHEKTLSPYLRIPRVIAEGSKRNGSKLPVLVFNIFCPLFRSLFSIKTANRIIDLDASFTKKIRPLPRTYLSNRKDSPAHKRKYGRDQGGRFYRDKSGSFQG